MFKYIFQDFIVNKADQRIVFVLAFFRITHLFAKNKKSFLWWLGTPIMLLYRLIVEYLFCIKLRPATKIGKNLKIEYGVALVINDDAIIGNNVHLRHCITIGCKKNHDGSQGPSPVIEDNVEIGAQSVILGGITIGEGAKIGAGSIVVHDVPANSVVVCQPARII